MHWKEVVTWNWPNFTPEEIACPSDGSIIIHEESLNKLQALRTLLKKPLHINSAYRSPAHNKEIGGSPTSQHLLGRAFDISLRNHKREELVQAARLVGFTGIGLYNTFVHVDTGPKRTWDNRT